MIITKGEFMEQIETFNDKISIDEVIKRLIIIEK